MLAGRPLGTATAGCDDSGRAPVLEGVTAPMAASSLAAALADAHAPAVRAYFRRALGRPDVADDLTQEVFVRVLRFADGYEARGRDRAWLFTIAHRVLVDHVRRAEPVAPVTADAGDAADLPVVRATQEMRVVLARALAALEALDRDAFLLAEVAGLSYAEIAAVLDLSHAAVRSRVFRARLALRAALAPASKGPVS
jgi:RNA polymerase sigma-70 factor, ECF subfamily